MILTGKEQEKVAKNIGLIHRVIQDKLQPLIRWVCIPTKIFFRLEALAYAKLLQLTRAARFPPMPIG